MAFDSVKKLATEYALDRAINYVTRDPENNLFVILNFLERVAILPEHKRMVEVVKNKFDNNQPIMEQAKRIAGNPKFLYNLVNSWVIKGSFQGRPIRDKVAQEIGASVPAAILIDPTSACNLRCDGCWAGEYSEANSLEPELFSRIIKEAKDIGIHWIVLSGGEPFVYPYLYDMLEEHSDSAFMAYTNGTLIDEKAADRLAELANLSPSFSLEGWRQLTDERRGKGTFDKVVRAMDLLRERGVMFGASVTATRNNVEELFSEEFMEFLVDKGVSYIWCFHYIPIGRNPNVNLMLTAEQRLWMVGQIKRLRKKYPMLIADFWNDGHFTSGCIAGGRQYFHINAAGDVEPCAFVHFAADNIKGKTLKEVLQNPLFKAYQKRIPFNENHLAPCPIIDAPDALREMVEESKAYPTHKGAAQVLDGEVACHLDKLSFCWQSVANGYRETEEDDDQKSKPAQTGTR